MDEVLLALPSSLSPANSDSDGINTSSAKIFIGQFQTPEKKLAALLDPAASPIQQSTLSVTAPGPSSLRRSPRVYASPARQDVREEVTGDQSEQFDEDEEEPSGSFPDNRASEIRQESWQDAPFLEFLRPDEPSSAIASRIMRAHDNPSPPPKTLRLSLSSRSSSNVIPKDTLPFTPSSSDNSDAAVESLLEPSDDFRISPTPPPTVYEVPPLPTPTIFRSISRSPTPRSRPHSSPPKPTRSDIEADLISFDRSVLMSRSPVDAEIHSPSPRQPQQLTIDDLLFSSPPQASSLNQKQEASEQEGSVVPPDQQSGSLNNPEESYSSPDTPDFNTGKLEGEGTKDESAVPCTPKRTVPQSEVAKNQTVPIPNSALRRSPRLSVLPPPMLQTTPRRSTPGRTPKAKTPKTDGSQARKRRRESPEKVARLSPTPRRCDWIVESDGSDNDTETFQSPSKKGKRDRKRIKKDADMSSNAAEPHLAESLSPGSALILSNLVSSESRASASQTNVNLLFPSTAEKQEARMSIEDGDIATSAKPSAPPSRNVQRPPPGVFAANIQTPSRGNLTRPYLAPTSPVKMTLIPASRDDPNRTPARRIPIQNTDDAVNKSDSTCVPPVLRPPVFSRSGFSRPASSRPPTNSLDKSPVKRNPPPGSILKVSSRETTDSQSPASRDPEVDPIGSSESVVDPDRCRLKADIPPSNAPHTKASGSLQHALPDSSTHQAQVSASGPSRILKPASSAESRIPRPGILPKAMASQKSKLPMPSARRPNGLVPAPSRLPSAQKVPLAKVAQLHSSASSSSDDSGASQSSGNDVAPTRKALTSALAKRKRIGEKPALPQQSIKGRKVIPGMYGGPVKTVALNDAEKSPREHQPHATVEQTLRPRQALRARRVTKGTLQDFELKGPLANVESSSSEAPVAEEKVDQEIQKEPSPPAPSLKAFTFECPAPNGTNERQEEKMEMDPASAASNSSDPLPPSDDITDVGMASVPDQASESGSSTRRSSRARRPVPTDVFGRTLNTTSAGPRPPARKARGGPPRARGPPGLLFSTNNLALKTLTNNNTTRNQNYLAQLEMIVVRKPGERPESPTMKLRTIVEKQKEEQGKMRAERARRRRGQSDISEGMGEQDDGQRSRHRRGPGDEDDYESPIRPNDGRKAVKWDRGLEVSVFLDEIEVHPRKYRAKGATTKPRKGCLIATPNRPLDDLGNPLDVDAPLNIVPETVHVTKYVYDNDEEAALFEPPAPKMTRSKAKKK